MSAKRISAWLGAAALFVTLTANATPITWSFTGSIKVADNLRPDVPGFVHVGADYTVSITFDPALFSSLSPCIAQPGGGCLAYVTSGSSDALQISVDFGSDCDGGTSGVQPCTPSYSARTVSSMTLWDDAVFPGYSPLPMDAISFALFPDGTGPGWSGERWQFALYGPTSIFTSHPSSLPLSPDPGFTLAAIAECDRVVDLSSPYTLGCAADSQFVYGDNFRSVPEPGTLALMGLGMGGIALLRRRRRV